MVTEKGETSICTYHSNSKNFDPDFVKMSDENASIILNDDLGTPNVEKDALGALGAFNAFRSLPPNFRYIIIALFVVFVSTRLIKAGPSHIFALITIYISLQRLSTDEDANNMSFNQEMDYRLGIIGYPSQF